MSNLSKTIRLSDWEQCLVRLAVQKEVLHLQKYFADVPAFAKSAETLKGILNKFYSGEIATIGIDVCCSRCEHNPCVCSNRDFETSNIIELDRAEDAR